MGRDRIQLSEFLRSRRDRITPQQAGITPSPGERRVPGLRREELAMLAGVSVDYYCRLEQGRQANISPEVLDALARALRLDDVERAHLHDLAAPGSSRSRVTADRPQRPDPGLLRVISMVDHLPALVIGRHGIVLARNALFCAVYGHPMEPGTSYTRYLLLDPDARRRILDWDACAHAAVAELRRTDPDVARWWDDHRVSEYSSAPRRIRHPVAGDLAFDVELLVAPQEPDQHLVLYTVEPHSRTARTLPLLAAWGTDTVASVAITEDTRE